MGQQLSAPQNSEQATNAIDALALQVFPEIDKYTQKTQANYTSDEEVMLALGFDPHANASHLFQRSASFLASYPKSFSLTQGIVPNLFKVIGFYDSKLTVALKISGDDWLKLLFLSFASKSKEAEDIDLLSVDPNQYYVEYSALFDVIAVLCQVFDKKSIDRFELKPAPEILAAVEKMLAAFHAPIVDWITWQRIFGQFPYLLESFKTIWDQLLYKKTDEASEPAEPLLSTLEFLPNVKKTVLTREYICLLYMVRGPEVFKAIKLFHAGSHGFSMRAFESKVVKWKAPTILVLRGTRATKHNDIDELVPKVTDTHLRGSKRVLFAVYVDAPWKTTTKRGFAQQRTTIYQLEPNLAVFKVGPAVNEDTIGYFNPIVGIGFGLLPPQTKPIYFSRNSNVALILDRFLEYGAFRCISDSGGTFVLGQASTEKIPYEDRFKLGSIEVWGIGDQNILDAQKREWEWENAEAKRRQSVNLGEDRSILELAGIVGQYDPDRGTN